MNDFLQKAVDKCGFSRKIFRKSENPIIFPFFGDLRSTFILSSLLKRNINNCIVCSWEGLDGLFPYVNEYWGVENHKIYADSNSFKNSSKELIPIHRNLYTFFDNIIDENNSIFSLYDKGLTKTFLEKYKIQRFLPKITPKKTKTSVFIYPSRYIQSYSRKDKLDQCLVGKDFWLTLINFLLNNDIPIVVYKDFLTYDLSSEVNCDYVNGDILAEMNAAGLVLDIFTGISRLAIAARASFIYVDERGRYNDYKEYEIDDICCLTNRQYIYSFSKIVLNNVEKSIFEIILNKINYLLPLIERSSSLEEREDFVPYDKIRDRKLKKLGIKWFKRTRSNVSGKSRIKESDG